MARSSWKNELPQKEERQFKQKQKIESSVFDVRTLELLSGFIKKKIVKSIDYPVATGKEADVFRATTDTGYVAVKIYRIETSNFQKMQEYMMGDPRFSELKGRKWETVFAWTRKEYSNLRLLEKAGVLAPKPITFKRNVLLMEFIGEEGVPDSTLKEMGAETPDDTLGKILDSMQKMHKAGIVHSDLSEYNIIMHRGEPVIIDAGQAVLLNHPKANDFLERDVRVMLKYFEKYGIKRSGKEVLEWIKKE